MTYEPHRVKVLGTDGTSTEVQLLVDAQGRLVVVDAGELGFHHGSATLLFAIPADVVSQVLAAGTRLHGFFASSQRYTKFELVIDGVVQITAYTTSDSPRAEFRFPVPYDLTAQQTVAIRGENLSDQGSSEAHATLLVTP